MNIIDDLTHCFSALPTRDLMRHKWHLEHGTRILCGREAGLYVSRDGGC